MEVALWAVSDTVPKYGLLRLHHGKLIKRGRREE